ncbi:MAG: GGDEF domain-containing protein [Gammaproteobacteria bacterium]|nr:GGDEF domain-containing protein [Gammaproteobacteria bacterium]MBL6998527.1 GGDEF domain-containing protein [Gammaproteobacteria bacterium]
MAEEKDWKAKYFDSLKQLEDMETTWYKLEKLLRRAISRLAITAKGFDSQLDQVLQKIQQHSRDSDNDALSADLDQLSTLLIKLDDVPNPASADVQNETSSIHTFLLQLIDQLRIDTDHKARMEALTTAIPQLDRDQCLQQFADILNQLLLHEPEDIVTAQNVLITLIEKITLTHGNTPELDVIQEKLGKTFDINEWGDYLDQIISEIHVIIRGINNEKVELESLIIDVTRQLNEISNVLTDEHNDTEEGRLESRRLQTLMQENVDSIQTKVDQETDLQRLKASISNNLNSIKTGVTAFIAKDNARYQKAELRNNSLQQQIKFMEQESDQLQQKLTENRQKLMFDTLTGVRSRLAYDELLDQELTRWSRYQDTFSFAILDIDHFKRVNDVFGHNAGDKALQVVANMLARHIRKTDLLFRIGGEEFVLLLPKTSLENATPLVEKIRNSVTDANFRFKQEKVDITLSAGLTAILAGDNCETIYERADSALYQAKNAGRNQLIVKIS